MTNNNNPKEKFKFNEKTLNTLLYVGAALLVVIILAVSIFAFADRNKKTEVPTTSGTLTGHTHDTLTDTPITTALPTTTGKVDSPDKPTVSLPSYVFPVEGTLAKEHDSEALVYSVTMNDYRVHLGIDVAAPVGSAVYAVASGTVKAVYQDYLMGTCVEIEHADGMVSCYKNLSETLPEGIAEGNTITSGQLIGAVGESAIIEQCDEPHLHFEMKKNGAHEDPLNHLAYGRNTETVEK